LSSADAIHAIWENPLDYDAVRNGPPYLPESGVRSASVDGQNLFASLCPAYEGTSLPELGAVLVVLRAAAMMHQTHHWQTRGQSFYGDHLLFERLYNESLGFIDQVAERAVGASSRMLVCPRIQATQIAAVVQHWSLGQEPDPSAMIGISLNAETYVLECLKIALSQLDSNGRLSAGTSNLLEGIADKHEEFIYLLQQRLGGSDDYTYER